MRTIEIHVFRCISVSPSASVACLYIRRRGLSTEVDAGVTVELFWREFRVSRYLEEAR